MAVTSRPRRAPATNLPSGIRARLDNDPAALEMFHVEQAAPPPGQKAVRTDGYDLQLVNLALIGLACRIATQAAAPVAPPRRLRAVPPPSAQPAPPTPFATGRFVRHLQLRLERLDGDNAGKMRLSTPQARGWAATVRPHPDPLWKAIREAFTEATVAGYARWQGAVYDHDALTERDDPTEPKRVRGRPDPELMLQRSERRAVPSWSRHSVTRPDSVDPADWTPLPDGRWRGPAGRAFRGDATQVVRMLRKRAQLDLPLSYDEHVARTGDDDRGENAQ